MVAQRKQYASPDAYEAKLARVIERMGATEYNYNWDRHMAWVEFRLKGQLYRFDQNKPKEAEPEAPRAVTDAVVEPGTARPSTTEEKPIYPAPVQTSAPGWRWDR